MNEMTIVSIALRARTSITRAQGLRSFQLLAPGTLGRASAHEAPKLRFKPET